MDIDAAGAVVLDDEGRLLMIRRGRPPARDRWSIPGGKAWPGETAEAACVREIREETALEIEVIRLLGVVRRPAAGDDEFVISDFLCRVLAGRPQAGDDAAEVRWCTRADLADLDLVPGLFDALAGWDVLPT